MDELNDLDRLARIKEGSSLYGRYRRNRENMSTEQVSEYKKSEDWSKIKEYKASQMQKYRKKSTDTYTPRKIPKSAEEKAYSEGQKLYNMFRKEKVNMTTEQIEELKKLKSWDKIRDYQANKMKKYRATKAAKAGAKTLTKKLPIIGSVMALASGDASAALPMGFESEALNENDPIERRLQLKAEGKREVSYEQKLREMRAQRQEWIKQGVIGRTQGESK